MSTHVLVYHNHVSFLVSLSVKLRVVSEHTHAVLQSPVALEIVRQPLLALETRVKCLKNQRKLLLPSLHLFRESKLEPVDDLPQCRVGICEFAADEVLALAFALVVFQYALEVGEELWDAVLAEVGRFLESGVLLVLVWSAPSLSHGWMVVLPS